MTRTYTTTLSLSIGGDTPQWEGEATVAYSVTWGRPAQTSGPAERCYPGEPDEVSDLTVTHIDGVPVAQREHGKHEAELLEAAIENGDVLLSDLITEAAEDEAARRDDYLESRADELRAEWGMGQ